MVRLKILFSLLFVFATLFAGASTLAASPAFPEVISLPDGWRPEGIVKGYGNDFYAGSLATGSIYKGNLQSGEGAVLIAGPGTPAVGLAFDSRTGFLFVAGGPAGTARVYDTASGELVGSYQLTTDPAFINDVVVTVEAAYFTNSFQPVLHKLPLSPSGGLPDAADVETLPLSGDFVMGPGFNANGIEASAQGDALIIVQSGRGVLYRVDPGSGAATLIDLGGASVSAGDGILLHGLTLYVLRNNLNQLVEIELAPDLASGSVVNTLQHPLFDVPTTLLEAGRYLYAVNARFSTPPTPDTDYALIQVLR